MAGGCGPALGQGGLGQASAEVAGDGADEPLTVDVHATLSIAHFDGKDGAAKTYKRTWVIILSTATSTAATVTRVADRAAPAGQRGLAHQRTHTGRERCRIATGTPPTTSHAPARPTRDPSG